MRVIVWLWTIPLCCNGKCGLVVPGTNVSRYFGGLWPKVLETQPGVSLVVALFEMPGSSPEAQQT
jgi:hypothetical protein